MGTIPSSVPAPSSCRLRLSWQTLLRKIDGSEGFTALKEQAVMTVTSKQLRAVGCPELRRCGTAGAFDFTVE